MEKKFKVLFAPWSCHNKDYCANQWYAPIKKIFKEVISFDPQEELYHHGKDEMNRKFLKLIEKEKPDYIFLWLIWDEFYIDTLLKIREISPKTKIINYSGDDDTGFFNYGLYYQQLIDYFILTQKEYVPFYKGKVFASIAADIDSFKPLNLARKIDVSFVGTPKIDRPEVLKYLMTNGINIKIYGNGWERFPEFSKIYGGVLDNKEYVKMINQSKINLGFTKNEQGQKHITGRPFEIGACKAFALTEYGKCYRDFFKEGKEIIMFQDKYDLLKKVRYYLKHEKQREKIAENLYKKIMAEFIIEKQFKKIFEKIFKEKNKLSDIISLKTNEKIIYLTEKDFSNINLLKEKLKNYDYICFKDKYSTFLPHKDFFQVYSLKETKKPVSFCDYYLYSKSLKDYMVSQSAHAFNCMPKQAFDLLARITCVMLTKKFFLENLSKFKRYLEKGTLDIINEKNTSFVSIPLVRINKRIKNANYDDIKRFFNELSFVNGLRASNNQGKLTFFVYLNKLVLNSVFQPFILKYLLESSYLKINSKIKKLFFKF